MNSNDFSDIFTESRRSTKVKYITISSLVVLFSLIGVIGFTFFGPNGNNDDELLSSNTEEAYFYGFVGDKCREGIAEYEKVTNDILGEFDAVEQLIEDPSWPPNEEVRQSTISMVEQNGEIFDLAEQRIRQLESCERAVTAKRNFSQAQLADIEEIVANVPVVVEQPTATASSQVNEYRYQSFNYEYEPEGIDYSDWFYESPYDYDDYQHTDSQTTQRQISNSTPAPRVCDVEMKRRYDKQYNSESRIMGNRHAREMDRLRESLSIGNTIESGLGRQEISRLQDRHRLESDRLHDQYQRQLQSIYC